MREYDLYINSQKPALGLYVRNGAGLPDVADPKEWIFDGTAAEMELAPILCKASKLAVTRSETWIEL